jgi:hypothetical protein
VADDALIVVEFAGQALAFTRRELDAARERAAQIGLGGRGDERRAEGLVDSKAMAALASVPVGQIEEHARQGLIPSVRVGKYRRFEPSRVIAALRDEGGR